MSSSSAFVVLAGCLFASANALQISEEELSVLMADAERYVGTRGGGMDQAAVLLAREGSALYMDFADWKPTPVPIPSGATLVVAHSTVPAPKSAEARNAYNLRAAESHMAGALLRQALNTRGWLGQAPSGPASPPAQAAPADVASRPAGSSEPAEAGAAPSGQPSREAGASLRIGRLRHEFPQADAGDTDTLVEQVLGAEVWRPGEVAARLGMSEAELFDRFALHDLPTAELQRGLKLAARARHIFDESRRVDRLCKAFAAGDLRRAGAIMNASHESCRDNYEISCRQVDELVEAERAAGALGARMTGAGFGGCTIYLVPSDTVEQSIRAVTREYYERRRGLTPSQCEDLIFPARAVAGAAPVSVRP